MYDAQIKVCPVKFFLPPKELGPVFNLYSVRRGAETWGFHEPPSYPHMSCFLAWRERIESSHKTHYVGTL